MKQYEDLRKLLEEMEIDVEKHTKGNKTAGKRIRKYCKDIILLVKEMKKETLL